MRRFWLSVSIFLLLIPSLGAAERDAARLAVREYLEQSIQRTRSDNAYWDKGWKTPVPSDVSELVIGEPTVEYQLRDDGELMLEQTGDLLAASKCMSLRFPVSQRGRHIGNVRVLQGSDGAWRFVGQSRPTSLDELLNQAGELAAGDCSSSVIILHARKFGLYVVVLVDDQPHFVLVPRALSKELGLDRNTDLTMDYPEFTAFLKALAVERKAKRQRHEVNGGG
jgi:hypothetical protein